MSDDTQANENTLEECLGEMVRSTVKEALYRLMGAEAVHTRGAERYK